MTQDEKAALRFKEWKHTFGTWVIMRPNEDIPLMIGTLVEFFTLGDAIFPKVQVGEEFYTCMGVMISHTSEMLAFLETLTPQKQWKILSNISLAIRINKG